VLALSLSANVIATAQPQKIGYVNTDSILGKMPAYEQAKQKLEQLSSQWRDDMQQMHKEIEQLKENYNAQKILYTKAKQRQKEQLIAKKTETLTNYRKNKFGADGAYYKQQQILLKPIQRKVYEAIKIVADQQNIDFVFDRAHNTTLLYAQNHWNLNEKVLQKLGFSLKD